MGFSFGGLIQGALPAAAGYYRGVTGANQLRRQYANEDAARERRMRLDALQEMLLKGQVDNFAADNARQDLQQQIGAKGSAEGRAIQMAQATKPPVPNEAYQEFIGPEGPGVYGITEGQNPRFLGKPIPKPPPAAAGVAGGTGTPPSKTLPASVATPIFENRRNLTTISAAREAVRGNRGAFGPQNFMPGYDYVDSKENVAARAPIANIGSLVIHSRSGAAVTISEYPRLKPFIPRASDTPEQVEVKLAELEREIRSITEDMTTYYREQGYAVPGDQPTGARNASPPGGAGKIMSPRAYEAAKANGYSDEEIRAEGYEVPQ